MDRFADDGKLGQGFTSADDLVEIDIGNGDRPRPTFISAKLDSKCNQQITNLLKEYKYCFAWDYTEMPGLDRSIVEHRLLSNLDFGHINSQRADATLIYFLTLRPK
jgi:hypothetical protein